MHNQFKTQKFKHLTLAMGPRDLHSAPYSRVHCSSHSITSFQSSELTELPVVENSQLFAQRVHSARYAPHGIKCILRIEIGAVEKGINRPLGKGPVQMRRVMPDPEIRLPNQGHRKNTCLPGRQIRCVLYAHTGRRGGPAKRSHLRDERGPSSR